MCYRCLCYHCEQKMPYTTVISTTRVKDFIKSFKSILEQFHSEIRLFFTQYTNQKGKKYKEINRTTHILFLYTINKLREKQYRRAIQKLGILYFVFTYNKQTKGKKNTRGMQNRISHILLFYTINKPRKKSTHG